ncbi:hypothetical protein [Flavobacterium sp. LB1P71]|uniref:hypothetical protein n=1 Tax=unclassified Flavobacterium TaxID=196869 RepID=UPI003AAEF8DC
MTILGGFIAVIITDYIKRPKLEIIFKKGADQQGGQKLHSYLVGTINNRPFNFFGIKINRDAAINCKASLHTEIVYHVKARDGRLLNDDTGNSISHRLLWEVELSSQLDRKKTIYCGIPENVRVFGKIEGEPGYFPYNYDDIFEIRYGGKYLEEKRKFILTISSIKGEKASKTFVVLNSGVSVNDIRFE